MPSTSLMNEPAIQPGSGRYPKWAAASSLLYALAVFYEAMEIFARKHFRGNDLLLLLVRIGIRVRRLLARIDERFPIWPFAIVDSILVL